MYLLYLHKKDQVHKGIYLLWELNLHNISDSYCYLGYILNG